MPNRRGAWRATIISSRPKGESVRRNGGGWGREFIRRVDGGEKRWVGKEEEGKEEEGKEEEGKEEEGKEEEVEKDLRSKRENIGNFRYISMPLIDVRIIREGWR